MIDSNLRLLSSAVLLATLAACGGGGSSSGGNNSGGDTGGDTGGDGGGDTPPVEVPAPETDAVLHLDYNTLNGAKVVDKANGSEYSVDNAFSSPELVPGIEGQALRTDGYSTWIEANLALESQQTLTVETWVALESYPSDAEVPHRNLSPSSFMSQRSGAAGFSFDINTFGQWEFSIHIAGSLHTVKAAEPFPLYEWTHIAAVVNTPDSSITLYRNGEEVASKQVTANSEIDYASNAPLIIGKSHTDLKLGIFLVNALSAAFDETRIYPGARTQDLISESVAANIEQADGAAHDSLIVPNDRFAHDLQRPRLHAMPPANWTNEPHGLLQVDGRFHMFYQRTPNGPYKTQMHWGHMYSDDLVHWEHEEDALWPTLELSDTEGYDMKGIWSGDVVYQDGTAYAFYTNVNHAGPFNPGVAMATSTHPNLRDWEKQGPLIASDKVQDFRDPYLWREGDTWHMMIGARVDGGGGLAYYTSTDLHTWAYDPTFAAPSYAQMDIGSDIWEMPVFEALDDKHLLIVNPIGGEVSKYGTEKPTRGVYWTGTWDGNTFRPDYLEPKNLDLIVGHLSPTVTRTDTGELVGIGIVDERRSSQAQLDAGWTHTFSFPREYRLLADGKTLGQMPYKGLQALRNLDSHQESIPGLVSEKSFSVAKGRSKEVMVEVNPAATSAAYGLLIGASEDGAEQTRIYYDVARQEIVVDKRNSSNSGHVEDKQVWRGDYDEAAFGKPQKFHVFIDHSIVDVFINDSAAFSMRIYPTGEDSDNVYLLSQGGETEFTNAESWTLSK